MITAAKKPCLKGLGLVITTIALSLGIFMNVLDVSIANVAIPVIAGNLAVSPDQGTWVITSFAVSQAIMLPITGWLARRVGEVKLFVISTFLFTVTSVLCGLSTSLSALVFFRVVQGAVSGPMIPLSQSLLLSIYPDDRKGFATGLWAMTAVVAPICGPVLGGWITDNYTWPWIFYINLPVGLVATFISWFMLRDRETATAKVPVDYVGLILLIIGIGALQILLDNGNDLDWFRSNTIIILAITSIVALTFLIAWELTDNNPIIDLSLFKNRNFTLGAITLTLGFTIYFGNVVIFPLWLQTQMGYTPTWAGLAAAPIGIIPFFLTPFVGQYMYRFDLRLIVSIGFFIFAATSFWSSNFYTEVGYFQVAEPRLIQGLGIALFFTPLIAISLSTIPPHRFASALGIANFMRILGGSFGTSISVTLWSRREAFHNSRLVEAINPYSANVTEIFGQLGSLGLSPEQQYQSLANIITQQAYMLATNEIFWLSGCLFLFLMTIIWLAKPPFTPSSRVLVD